MAKKDFINNLIKEASKDASEVKFEPQIDIPEPEKNTLLFEYKFNQLFKKMRDSRNRLETRTGLHASAILGSNNDFCFRQQVLSLIYQMDQGHELPVSSLRIFAAGESIHEKWQNMLEKCSDKNGIKLIKNEARSYDSRYNLLFTPDSIIEIDGLEYVVEYKSMNTFSFKKTDPRNPHPSARKQIMLYMFLKGIPRGIILMEDKNTQEFKLSIVKFNYKEVIPYIERLIEIKTQYEEFVNDKIAPKRICKNPNTKRAQNCPLKGACFYKNKRIRIGE